MTTVSIGTFNVLKQLPVNTHLMAAWSARWTFGNVKIGDKYVIQVPMIRDQVFWTSRDPLNELAVPGTHPALIVELKTVGIGGRSSLKSFPAIKHNIVATPEDQAWVVPPTDYWKAISRYGDVQGPAVSLKEIPSFTLTSLIGEAEFKKMVNEIKTKVRKL